MIRKSTYELRPGRALQPLGHRGDASSLIGLYGAGVLLAEIERDLGHSLGTARTASRC